MSFTSSDAAFCLTPEAIYGSRREIESISPIHVSGRLAQAAPPSAEFALFFRKKQEGAEIIIFAAG